MPHLIGELITAASQGRFPPADGAARVVPAPKAGLETVMAFTGHAVVATALDEEAVLAQSPDGFGGAIAPRFLLWLAGENGVIGSHDIVLVATGRGDSTLPIRRDLDGHPRVRHARSLRQAVAVYGDDRGLVTVGSGLGRLTELSVAVVPERQEAGVGRSLVHDALGLIADGTVVVAEVAPGNARSLRAFLASGFKPIGSAVHVIPGTRG